MHHPSAIPNGGTRMSGHISEQYSTPERFEAFRHLGSELEHRHPAFTQLHVHAASNKVHTLQHKSEHSTSTLTQLAKSLFCQWLTFLDASRLSRCQTGVDAQCVPTPDVPIDHWLFDRGDIFSVDKADACCCH